VGKEAEQYREHWSREGFYGDGVNVTRGHHSPDYLSVSGPHAPHLLNIREVSLRDREDPEALPIPIMVARSGTQLSVSGRAHPMPFVVSNVEADEVHFIQEGEVTFVTSYGSLMGGPGDFVIIPRGVPYSVRPTQNPYLAVIVETPGALAFDPAPSFEPEIERSVIDSSIRENDETMLLIKSFDGVTRYAKPTNPLASAKVTDGTAPVWKLNLESIPMNEASHPTQFVASPQKDELFYNLSARHRRRPPIHNNVDYDELVFYFAGPGTWGRVSEPGTLTWVPKGVLHHGPSEDVPEGYLAWMLESRPTLRLTKDGLAVAQLMETDLYGPHAP
jgi:homogentisate 1,2-dioxygenase